MLTIITAAVIVLGIIAESLYSHFAKKRLYNWSDSFLNVSALAFEQVFQVLVAVPVYLLYMAVYEHRLVASMPGWLAIVVAILGVDIGFYCWHRLSHNVSLLWFGHAVHHSSEEFNVSVAIRSSGWALFTQRFFYLPMAIVGVPVEAAVLADGLSNLYTLFVHNRVIPKLGFLEEFMVTPSHHRVHHARNSEYLDMNYGATFIIWDRLFGTYVREDAPPLYGLRHPLKTHNVGWARFHLLFEIADRMRRSKSILQAISAPFRPPGWDPDGDYDTTQPAVPQEHLVPKATGFLRAYAIVQHVVVFAGVAAFMIFAGRLDSLQKFCVAMWLWVSLAVAGALLDSRAWAKPAEAARWLVAASVAVLVLLPQGP